MDRAKKVVNEKHESILLELSKQPGNDTCADCGAKGPRWASYNLGIFLCIRCCGFHRKMGTHISKVKSITLDSWTPEQIESMRQWGNLKANAKWDPHPELHPISITASDSEIERYIRNKYERMAFRDNKGSQSKNPVSSTSSKRSTNYSTKNVDQGSYDLALRQLKDMGFTDMTRNREVLVTTNGNLSSAIEILCRLPGGNSKPVSSNSNISSASNAPPKSDDEKLAHLKKLGFHDDAKNREILRRTGGNVEVAVTLLTENRSSTSQNASNLTLNIPLQMQSQQTISAAPSSQNPGSQQLSSQQSSNIWGEFSQGSVNVQQQQQKAKLDKDAIMSLYNTPKPSVYSNLNQTSQFGTPGVGIMQNQTGQFGMMQQQNQTGQFGMMQQQNPTGQFGMMQQQNPTGQFGMMQQQNKEGQFGMMQQQNQAGQLGFPVQTNDFGLNSAGTLNNNNMIPYGNVNQQTTPSNMAYAGVPVNNSNSFGTGDLNNGYGGLGNLNSGASGLVKNPATNYGFGGTPGFTTSNSTNTNAINTMGTLNRQNSIPFTNTQPAFGLVANNNQTSFGSLTPSYSTVTPNGGMNQQQTSLALYNIQHTGGYPNGQQNHGFQKNSLL
ncbi:7220_t:CDS:2 [Acaulospora morrowiae]|uniref:7220_t:CDS:1 n=1 Tax=Acaulospora morrowiae TaxID=94023 RepID=A0A9N9FJ04_9GLOM|nr:7220_t:CDS:2 [Acaulospora morrowiae]